VVQTDGGFDGRPGDALDLWADRARLHLFDSAEQRVDLEARRAEPA